VAGDDVLDRLIDAELSEDLLHDLDQVRRQLHVVLLVDLGESPGPSAVLPEQVIVNLRQLELGSSDAAGPDVGGVHLDDPGRGSDQRCREGKGGEFHDCCCGDYCCCEE
jgi:hypothetical protein